MSTIVTFYSYKGGVGRTMAMANVAVLLALRKLKVLVIDWDLEAPGLERYFAYFSVARTKAGLLRLLRDHRFGSRGHYQSYLARVSGEVDGRPFGLHLLPSGRETDPEYSAMLEQFDWEGYFAKGGGDFIEDLRTRWRRDYDVVLVDSRTGLSDTGGICTIQLPDVVVAMFTANYQSVYGTRDTMRLAQRARDQLAFGRMHLRVLPVASRFSANTDNPEAGEWLGRIGEALGEFYRDWVPKWATPRQVSEALRIPQVDAFGFGEKLALVEGDTTLTAGYEQLAELLAQEVADTASILGLTPPRSAAPSAPEPRRDADYEYDLFVSRADSVFDEWIDALIDYLRQSVPNQLGRKLSVFRDRSEVRVDEVWRESIAKALGRSRLLLAIVTPAFAESTWCRLEWASFERRERIATDHSALIVPVMLRKAIPLPGWIASRVVLDLSDLPMHPRELAAPSERTAERLERLVSRIALGLSSVPPFDREWTASTLDPMEMPLESAPFSDSGTSETPLAAEALTALLGGDARPDAVQAARTVLQNLRSARDFATMTKLAAATHRQVPNDAEVARIYALGLIETGDFGSAQSVLTKLMRRLPKSSPEFVETAALLGRAHKNLFIVSKVAHPARARSHLTRAIGAYRAGLTAEPLNAFLGANFIALMAAAHRRGGAQPPHGLAYDLLDQLATTPESVRSRWDYAIAADLYLALGIWDAFGAFVEAFAADPDVTTFELQSVLQQLVDVWEIESDPRAEPYLAGLRARLLSLPGGTVEVAAGSVAAVEPERLLAGSSFDVRRARTMDWFRTGLHRAQSVGVVTDSLGQRIGTCFLVEGRDFGLSLDEPVVVTASHIFRLPGSAENGHQTATVVFEGVTSTPHFQVAEQVWSSPPDKLDATVLRLMPKPHGLAGLPLATRLPSVEDPQAVYIVGHPGGRGLSISMQDQELLDHEGPPQGRPKTSGVVRLHYRAATEPGSSGSPVFNENWEVVAIHHLAGSNLLRLNGNPGTYEASEGISIQSISAAIKMGKSSARGGRVPDGVPARVRPKSA